jgi:tetratricopeptide (TPR) repeat protein
MESGDIYNSLLHKERLIYLEALYKTLKTLDITTKETFILLNQIINVFLHLGKLNLSLEILTMANKMCHRINSIDDESLSRFHTLSGQIYTRKGDHKKSLEHSKLACSLAEKSKSASPKKLAGLYSNLGHVCNTFGDVNNALKSFKNAQKHLASEGDCSNLSYIYKGIAETYKISGDYEKALKYFKEALKLRKRFLKLDTPLIAQSYNDLAFIYVQMNQRKKALALYIKAMRGNEAILGDEHIQTASSYNNLGELYRFIKQYKKAYPLIKKAITIRELQQEANPIDLAISYNTMGVYYSDINKYDEAINYLTKAFNILNSTLGPHHEKTIMTKENIEYVYSDKANYSNRNTNHIKIGKNSPCSCGSGKKYKRCCGES